MQRVARSAIYFARRNSLLAVLLAALVSGCDSRKSPATADATVRIFCTVQATTDLARQIGGKYVDTDFAIESGQSLNDFQPDSEMRRRMNDCQLILAGGAVDAWAVTDSTNPYAVQRVLRFDAIARPSDSNAQGLLWLDPVMAQAAGDELARRLSVLRSPHQSYFTAQAQQFRQSLDSIIAEYNKKFADAARKRVLALSQDFDPLAARFNVDVVHPLNKTADRLNEDDIRQLVQTSREEHVVLLVVRADTPPALVQQIAERGGFRIITFEAYGSSANNGHNSYQAMLRFNLDHLLSGLNSK